MEPKCPFAAPLTQPQYHCHLAEEVVRRGGSEFNCRDAASHSRCLRLHEQLKQAALPAFEVEDDLLSMPHSVLVKIQYGGLLGLQRLLLGSSHNESGIEDIDHLVGQTVEHYGGVEDIPCTSLTGDMQAFRVSRRRREK